MTRLCVRRIEGLDGRRPARGHGDPEAPSASRAGAAGPNSTRRHSLKFAAPSRTALPTGELEHRGVMVDLVRDILVLAGVVPVTLQRPQQLCFLAARFATGFTGIGGRGERWNGG